METVVRVIAKNNFFLELWFSDGQHRIFDAKPYLEKGVFVALKDPVKFQQAYVAWDTVYWLNNLDIAPETLYDASIPI